MSKSSLIEETIHYISHNKSKIGTWKQCALLYQEKTGETIASDTLRMRVYTQREKEGWGDDVFIQYAMEKVQFRDERNALNAKIRNQARLDQKLDYLSDTFSSIQKIQFPKQQKPTVSSKSKKSIAILLSDWHIGLSYKNIYGEYNSEIAKKRLGILLNKVKSIQIQSKAPEAHIIILGDMISGNIHKSIAIENRENVIDQMKIATELLTNFCYECLGMFENVVVTGCPGNHTRIDRKEDAINDERLDNFISWTIEQIFQNEKRIRFTKCEDSTLAVISIRGKTYYCVHGDYDGYNEAAADRLIAMTGEKPEAIFYGHMHTPAYMEAHDMKLIRSGCLSGSGDEYTIRKRLFGRPCQTIAVCGTNGVEIFIPAYLD